MNTTLAQANAELDMIWGSGLQDVSSTTSDHTTNGTTVTIKLNSKPKLIAGQHVQLAIWNTNGWNVINGDQAITSVSTSVPYSITVTPAVCPSTGTHPGTVGTATQNLYVGLYSMLPGGYPTETAGTELTVANGYARIAIQNNETTFPPASARTKTNGAIITFNACISSSWAAVVGFGFWDAPTGGNNTYYNPLSNSPITITPGQIYLFSIGSIQLLRDVSS